MPCAEPRGLACCFTPASPLLEAAAVLGLCHSPVASCWGFVPDAALLLAWCGAAGSAGATGWCNRPSASFLLLPAVMLLSMQPPSVVPIQKLRGFLVTSRAGHLSSVSSHPLFNPLSTVTTLCYRLPGGNDCWLCLGLLQRWATKLAVVCWALQYDDVLLPCLQKEVSALQLSFLSPDGVQGSKAVR